MPLLTHPCVTHTNLGSFLNVEDFFNSSSSLVRDVSGGQNGGFLWPVVTALPEPFSSEGHLVNILIDTHGGDLSSVVDTMHRFRDTFYTERDFRDMYDRGVQKVRIPVGWWAFELPGTDGMVTDPYLSTVRHVPVRPELLRKILSWCYMYRIEVMMDLHAVQGGSAADGASFNGVSDLAKPVFWDRVSKDGVAQNAAIDTWLKMLAWREALPEHLRQTITGMSPLNEPAHLLPIHNTIMLEWMGQAIARFRGFYAGRSDVPALYVNLIETAWTDDTSFPQDTADFMAKHTHGMDPAKVYLDVHRYLAWEYYNDAEYARNPFETSVANKRTPIFLAQQFRDWQDTRKKLADGRWRLATSEWSAAWSHLSSESTPDPHWIDSVFKEQIRNMPDVEHWFWSWKIPGCMEHALFWSLRTVLDCGFTAPVQY